MTTIERLGILGIRSYGPEQEQAITFTPPLTLILGPNGSGKTTVIESLRMATCGVLPPNSGSGQAFVHDPRVSHVQSTETKAKIRLRFVNSGNKVTISRLFQLSNKKVKNQDKQTFKQMEGSIEIKPRDRDKGQDTKRITNKCAEIDKLIPELMGVSQAVLQNVIFCHQEESNWILAEPKVLKDKFDAIFASTRYSKALEQVKKTQTDLKNQIKEIEKTEAEQKVYKQHAHEYTQKLRKCEHDKHEAQLKQSRLRDDIKKAEDKIKKCQNGLQEYVKAEEFMNQCDQKVEIYEDERTKVHDRLPNLLNESDEELHKAKRDIERKLQCAHSSKRKDREEADKARAEKEACSSNLNEKQAEHSKLQARRDVMKSQEQERTKLASSIADKYDLDQNLVPVKFEKAPSTFFREVKNRYEARNKESNARKRENSRALDKIQEELDAANQKYSRQKHDIEHTIGKITEKSREHDRVQADCGAMCFDEQEVARLEAKAEQLKKEMYGDMQIRNPDDITSEIESKRGDLQRKQRARDQLNVDLKARRADLERIAVVKNKKKELEKRKQDVAVRMASEHALEELLNYKPTLSDVDTMTEAVKREKQTRKSDLENAQQERMKAKTMLVQMQGALKEKETEHAQLKTRMSDLIRAAKNVRARGGEEVKGLQEAVEGAAGSGKSFEDLLASLEKKKAKQERQQKFAESMKGVVEQFRHSAQSKQCCPLCESQLASSAAMDKFEEKLVELTEIAEESTGGGKDSAEQKIMVYSAHIAALKEAQVKFVESAEVHSKVQALSNQEDALRGDIREAQGKLQDAEAREKLLQECFDKAEHVEELLRQFDIAGLQSLEKSVKSDETELSKRDIDERGITSLEDEHSELEAAIERLDKDVQKLWQERQTIMDETQKRTKIYQEAKEKLNEGKRRKESYEEKLNRKEGLKRDVEGLKQEKRRKEEQLPELEDKIKECKEKQSRQRVSFEAEDRKSDLEINDMWKEMSQLEEYEKQIAEFKQQKLEEKERLLRQQIDEDKDTLKDLDDKYTAAKAKCANSGSSMEQDETILREINDNLSYRDYTKKIEDLKKEKYEKEEELNTMPTKQELRKLLTEMQKEHSQKNDEEQQLKGVMHQLQQQAKDHEKKLQEKEYVDIDKRYKKTQIGIETHKGASKDLDKYYAALDKALMRFHEMKMEEINKYVKEYWQTTYKGDDIETIEVKADLENTAGRRSHNYRLVMRHRHLSELDMRGRCSAGQKVLASLVVRLALAETFCHNCGVLALDEPTSNLDERNIQGFTEALGRIVNDRKQAKNSGFQLIVISHDNEFIDNLARLTDVPEYFRVSKDPSTQYSQISVYDVTDF